MPHLSKCDSPVPTPVAHLLHESGVPTDEGTHRRSQSLVQGQRDGGCPRGHIPRRVPASVACVEQARTVNMQRKTVAVTNVRYLGNIIKRPNAATRGTVGVLDGNDAGQGCVGIGLRRTPFQSSEVQSSSLPGQWLHDKTSQSSQGMCLPPIDVRVHMGKHLVSLADE